jgi:hypothetical protein
LPAARRHDQLFLRIDGLAIDLDGGLDASHRSRGRRRFLAERASERGDADFHEPAGGRCREIWTEARRS